MIRLLPVVLAAVLFLASGMASAADTPADDIGATMAPVDFRGDSFAGAQVATAVDDALILRTPRAYPVIPAERTVIQQ